MIKILLDINIKYETFSKAEKKVADYIIENPNNILPLFITELSNICGASTASIVRFAKKLGYDGYHQLKFALAKESSSHPLNENITASDSAFSIFEKICDDVYYSLEKTKSTIDICVFCIRKNEPAHEIALFTQNSSIVLIKLIKTYSSFRLIIFSALSFFNKDTEL